MNIVFALLLALSAPLFLLLVEVVLPYPFVVEELVKLIAVILIVREEQAKSKNYCFCCFLVGALFTASESIFYLVNIFANGNLLLFPKRILLTGTLHIGTTLLMYFLGRKKKFLLIAGLILAILVHYFFNLWIGSF